MRSAKERLVCATEQIFSKKGYSRHALLFLINDPCSEYVIVPLRNQKSINIAS